MAAVYVIFTMTKEGGFPEEVEQALNEALQNTRKQAGCVFYNLTKDVSVPGMFEARKDTYNLVQEWKSMQALQQHVKYPYVQKFFQVGKKHQVKTDAKFFEKIR